MSLTENILVIDDEIQIRRLLKISLENSGFKVFEAEDAKSGLQEVVNARPSLILLDLGLPDEDGLDLLKNIRDFSSIPIIILSVRNSEKDIITAGTVIIDFYLYKDKKRFDTTIRCLPPINDGAIPNIATSKKQKFFTLGSNAPDFNMFALFYNFVKFRDISKFPVATISEAHSRIKDIDPDTYIRNFVLALTKEVS